MPRWLSTLTRELDWYAFSVLGPVTVVLATQAAVGGWRLFVASSILIYLGFRSGVMLTRRALLRELITTGRIRDKKSDDWRGPPAGGTT